MPPRRHVSLRSRLIALVVAFTACLALAAPAGAALPRDFIGLGADDVFAGDPNYRTSNLSAQSAIGVGLLRQLFN